MRNKLSKVTLVIIAIYYLIKGFDYRQWKDLNIIQNDAVVYYCFLPAAFIYHDLSFQFYNKVPLDAEVKMFCYPNSKGQIVQKTTVGVALLQAPFFGLAHAYCLITGQRANGYSVPYQFMVFIAALFYLMAGLLFLRKSLLKFFEDKMVALTLCIIALATNVFCYTILLPGMSHVYSFALMSAFCYLILLWHEKPSFAFSVYVGLCFGFIALIRLPNVIIILVPFLWQCTSFAAFQKKIMFLLNHIKHLLIIAVAAFFIFSIQMLYNKYITGTWWHYAYGDERFYFSRPHLLEGLFGFRKGFFIYTPVMLLLIIGFIKSIKNKLAFSNAIFIFFIVYSYVIFSWWCWWYGGGFGSRAMIDIYAILALPLAAAMQFFLNAAKKLRFAAITFIVFAMVLNLFQTWQFSINLLWFDGMTFKYYKNIWASKVFYPNHPKDIKYADIEYAMKGLPERDVIYFDITHAMKLLETDTVHLMSKHNKYVCALLNKNKKLAANSNYPWECETFIQRKYIGDLYTFEACNSYFLGAEGELNSPLRAGYRQNEGQCVFRLINMPDGNVVLKTNWSLFIAVDTTNNNLLIGKENVGEADVFKIIRKEKK